LSRAAARGVFLNNPIQRAWLMRMRCGRMAATTPSAPQPCSAAPNSAWRQEEQPLIELAKSGANVSQLLGWIVRQI
jgi:hypothetical protein